jgi:RNA-splicing ligase RtcB
MEAEKAKKEKAAADEKARHEAELKVKLSEGKISLAEYQTLVSTETQNKELPQWGDAITGEHLGQMY